MALDDTRRERLRWPLLLSGIGVGLSIVVILAGTWTRLMDAGLGCPDWPGCYGRLIVPPSAEALTHSPLVPLEPVKAWLEMLHRYMAFSLGLLILALIGFGLRQRQWLGYPWRLSLGILALVLAQGMFGAFTVTLKLWPQVVTMHLLGGLGILLSLFWLHLRLRCLQLGPKTNDPEKSDPGSPGFTGPRLSLWWTISAGLLLAQLALGGWTSSNYAGIACQGFPTCNGQWWPLQQWLEGFNLFQQIGPNYLYGQLHAPARTAIHVTHRLGALVLGLSLLILVLRHWPLQRLRRALIALLAAYLTQVALGIANVLLALPLWLALLHTAGAIVLVLIFTLALWQARGLFHQAWLAKQVMNKEWAHA